MHKTEVINVVVIEKGHQGLTFQLPDGKEQTEFFMTSASVKKNENIQQGDSVQVRVITRYIELDRYLL
jgi:hypothetical protein